MKIDNIEENESKPNKFDVLIRNRIPFRNNKNTITASVGNNR